MSGEYERFSTTVVSAYIGPIVSDYLLALEARLAGMGFKGSLMMVRSDGLVQSAAHSRRQAVTLINSGPAAAPTAARFYGRLLGHEQQRQVLRLGRVLRGLLALDDEPGLR